MKPISFLMLNRVTIYLVMLILVSLLFVEFIYGPAIHETSHSFACFISGNNPEQDWANVKCPGIENSTDFEQFLYFMMPYLTGLVILIFILFSDWKYSKYFILLPFFDLVINYSSSGFGHSDFVFITNIFDYAIFIISTLFILMMIFTVLIILKKRILQLSIFEKDFDNFRYLLKKRILYK